MNETLALIDAHRTFRAFRTGETLPPAHAAAVLAAAQRAPSWMNGQHYSIIGIDYGERAAEIAALQPANPQIAQCALFWIFVADLHKAALCGEAYGGTFAGAGGADALLTAAADASFAAQNALTAAESLGYGTCFVGGIRKNAAELVRLLSLPAHTFPLFGLCIGTPDLEMRVKPRLPASAVFAENRYPDDDILRRDLAAYEQTMTEFGEAREKLPYRQKFSHYYSNPYTPENHALLRRQGWLTDTE